MDHTVYIIVLSMTSISYRIDCLELLWLVVLIYLEDDTYVPIAGK